MPRLEGGTPLRGFRGSRCAAPRQNRRRGPLYSSQDGEREPRRILPQGDRVVGLFGGGRGISSRGEGSR